jgi:glycosyltransferase involved in cell wall biosynthesis
MTAIEVPTFSILCATYNHAEYLRDMLNSVEQQTWMDYELVVVDDGSKDDTPEVLRTWLETQNDEMRSRTKVLRTEQSGQSAAWEAGFAITSGRWICFLDSDDTFLPHKLETLAKVIDGHPGIGMIQHPLIVVDRFGIPTGDLRPQSAALSSGDLRAQMRHDGRHVAPGASGLAVDRDTMNRLVPMPTKGFRFAADWYISFGAIATAPVLALPQPLARYRMQPDGQYMKRMLNAEGLLRQVEFQETIARHFGLLDATRRNSFFCRNVYAARRFNGVPGAWSALKDLVRATARDQHFSVQRRAALLGIWIGSAVLPRALFVRFWRAFQMRQTGWNRITVRPQRTEP